MIELLSSRLLKYQSSERKLPFMQIFYILGSFLSDFAKITTNVQFFTYRYLFNSITNLCTVVDDSSSAGLPCEISVRTISALWMACF